MFQHRLRAFSFRQPPGPSGLRLLGHHPHELLAEDCRGNCGGGTRELARGHHRGCSSPSPVATPPTAARAARDPEFLPEPPNVRTPARGPRASPLWGARPHTSLGRGGERCARHLSLSPGPSPGLLGATPGWRGGHGLLGVIAACRLACAGTHARCPRPLRALISGWRGSCSGPRGGVFWKMTDREPMGWAGSNAAPNDRQAGARRVQTATWHGVTRAQACGCPDFPRSPPHSTCFPSRA